MTSGVRTGAPGPPEGISRKRTPIPSRPDLSRIQGLRGEISRLRSLNPELEIVLQHMLDEVEGQLEVVWEALDILDKRFDEFEPEDQLVDTEFREINRSTQRRKRVVEDDDSDIKITVLDVITQTVTVRGNKTGNQYTFIFREPLPA